jgi:hypothetical protein
LDFRDFVAVCVTSAGNLFGIAQGIFLSGQGIFAAAAGN